MSQFVSFNAIIGNGKSYKTPIYQRDYSWTKEEQENLWSDILEIPNDKTHYLGYIVLQPAEEQSEESHRIIDGQQRLTTLSIVALAVTALLKEWSEKGIETDNNRVRLDKITERYLGNFSASKLTISPKITLNRNNDDYYKSWLLKLRRPVSLAKLKPSQRLLQNAFNYFFEKLAEKFQDNTSGSDLVDFLEKTIGNGIQFTQIIVTSDLDAFKVFETINARGVKLSTADLLKNYLFKLTHQLGEIDLDAAERQWNNIADAIRADDLTAFIRHYRNSAYKLERQPTLFKAIKREINTAEKAFEFLNKLETSSQYYTAFNNPNDELWSKDERLQMQLINLLDVTTCFPLMLAGLEKLERNNFYLLLREISVIALRHTMANLNPNTAETIYSEAANQLQNGEIKKVRDVVMALRCIYVDDAMFEESFAKGQISTRRKKDLVKYILVKLENQIGNTEYNYEDASATIEHILPENPGRVWEQTFSPEIQDDFIYRLGNYTLLKAGVNNKLDNETPFAKKLEYYRQSAYKLSSEYCSYDDFKPTTLQLRQERMAKAAKAVWKSAFIE